MLPASRVALGDQIRIADSRVQFIFLITFSAHNPTFFYTVPQQSLASVEGYLYVEQSGSLSLQAGHMLSYFFSL